MTHSSEYSYRPTIRKIEHRFKLTESGLSFESSRGETQHIDFDQVKSVNLAMIGNGRYRMVVKDASGKKIQLFSHHFISFGNFESRIPAFQEFVEAFFTHIAGRRESIRVTLGVPALYYTMIVCIGIVALMIVGLLVAMILGKKPPGEILARMAWLVALMVVLAIPITKKGKPKGLPADSDAWRDYIGT